MTGGYFFTHISVRSKPLAQVPGLFRGVGGIASPDTRTLSKPLPGHVCRDKVPLVLSAETLQTGTMSICPVRRDGVSNMAETEYCYGHLKPLVPMIS